MPVNYIGFIASVDLFNSGPLQTYEEVKEKLDTIRQAIATSLGVSINCVDIEIDESAGTPEGGWPESEGVNLPSDKEG